MKGTRCQELIVVPSYHPLTCCVKASETLYTAGVLLLIKHIVQRGQH